MENFKKWFYHKHFPHSHLDKHYLLMDSLYLLASLIFSIIIYKNILLINEYILVFLKVGSVLLLIGTFLCLRFTWKLIKNLKYGIRGFNNGFKLILILAVIIFLLIVYFNQDKVIPQVKSKIDEIQFSSFNPLSLSESTLNEGTIASQSKSIVDKVFAPPEPISDKTKQIEQAILKYTNQERADNSVRVLKWDSKLADVARAHSLDMVQNDFFSHTNLKGEDPTARAIRMGYNVHKELGGGYYSDGIAENIGKMPTGSVQGVGYVSSDADSIAKAQVQSWMDSPGHRQNILNSQYDTLGVGVAYDGQYYVSTQNFK